MIPRDQRVSINHEFASIEELVSEYVTNISRSGVFIRSENPLPIGTLVNLCFSVILDDLETVTGVGKVVRVSQDPRGMGIVFVELDTVSEKIVESLFARPIDERSEENW
ncbi:MAG TPA: PilZ domain-containing protein [Kofleriaceae bacterium]|nr:PilZ domain-containing protein [Kofleriaceae bacterium]